MKRWILLLAFMLCLGCSDSNIELVKSGTLKFDPSITVGKAFDNSPAFESTDWTEFESPQGREVVEFRGVLRPEDYLSDQEKVDAVNFAEYSKLYFVVQFFVSVNDDGYQIGYVGYEYKTDEQAPVDYPFKAWDTEWDVKEEYYAPEVKLLVYQGAGTRSASQIFWSIMSEVRESPEYKRFVSESKPLDEKIRDQKAYFESQGWTIEKLYLLDSDTHDGRIILNKDTIAVFNLALPAKGTCEFEGRLDDLPAAGKTLTATSEANPAAKLTVVFKENGVAEITEQDNIICGVGSLLLGRYVTSE